MSPSFRHTHLRANRSPQQRVISASVEFDPLVPTPILVKPAFSCEANPEPCAVSFEDPVIDTEEAGELDEVSVCVPACVGTLNKKRQTRHLVHTKHTLQQKKQTTSEQLAQSCNLVLLAMKKKKTTDKMA
jgi:hypothetical protein